MKIIVDANIVFSGILNTEGKIADVLIHSGSVFKFIAPDFLKSEIRKHYLRLCEIAEMTLREVKASEKEICKSISFYPATEIKLSVWKNAEKLIADIDANDVHYIAFAKHLQCKLWSGDKQLIKGLKQKGFHDFISADELLKIRARLIS